MHDQDMTSFCQEIHDQKGNFMKQEIKIKNIHGREILDSRGNPTV